jgi:glycosyltransferase involved in cell wall biosynthesis
MGGLVSIAMVDALTAEPASFRPAVVAPTFNNARTLGEILARLEVSGLAVFVVNDGSTDGTGDILADWQSGGEGRHVCVHPANRGKAAALHSGFEAADAAGFSHAVTIDTDGQLPPEDVPAMLAAAAACPAALVLGARDESARDYPVRSRLGRRVSNLLVRWECGQRVLDSQCGLRVYPLALARAARCRAEYFGFETEIIVRAAWEGRPIISVPVRCRYFTASQRVSHFRPWRDSFRAVAMHLLLLVESTRIERRATVLTRAEESASMEALLPLAGSAE